MPLDITNADLVRFLKTRHHQNAGFFDRLKLYYRPYICPFVSLLSLADPEDRVGDIGCGSGQFLLLLSHFVQPAFSFGIEISPHLIDNARNLFRDAGPQTIRLETYDGTHFPDTVASLDVIFLIDVLHHVPPALQSDFLGNLAAAMKKGASLIVKDIDAGSPLVYCNKLHDLIVSRDPGHELKIPQVTNMLKKAGLEITKIEKCTTYVYPHYTVVTKKP